MNDQYIGPKAIFDPNFVPRQILFRKKEEQSLLAALEDSVIDNYSLTVLYQGIQGIGKKVIINKVLSDFATKKDLLKPISIINVDCSEKSLEELITALLVEINRSLCLNLDLTKLITAKVSDLWSTFKLAISSSKNNLILHINNAENLKSEVFKKILSFCKELKTPVISTVNKVLKAPVIDNLGEFDVKERLNCFSYKELFSILKTRSIMAFPREIDKELIEFITDLIHQHYAPVPGKGIEIFRTLYPALKSNKSIEISNMLDLCQDRLDMSSSFDDYYLLNYISEEDLSRVVFIDNLSDHFLNKAKYYISKMELNHLYQISCESIEYDKNLAEFNELISSLERIGILNSSKKNDFKSLKAYSVIGTENTCYFLTLNPIKLKAMIDAIFNKTP